MKTAFDLSVSLIATDVASVPQRLLASFISVQKTSIGWRLDSDAV
jgi:hypothetical protein